MSHIPFGYQIVDGKAEIVGHEAEIVRNIFKNYISGMSLKESAHSAGHPIVHSMVKRLLQRQCYLGDDFYPQIVDKEMFVKANEELVRRAANLNHPIQYHRKQYTVKMHFTMDAQTTHYESPAEQAEYLYSLIGVK